LIKSSCLGLVLPFLLLIGSINGQNIQKYDLEKCISTALENNHSLKQVRIDKAIAEEQVSEAYGTSLYPKIDGFSNYNRAIKRGEITIETPFFSGSFPSGTKNTLTAGVNLEQPLFTGAMFLAVKIAKTFAEISNQRVQYSEHELVAKVKEAYYVYLLSKEFLGFSKLQLKRAEENYRNTSSRYEAGLVSEYDKIKANVQKQNLIPALTEAENQLLLAGNNLKLILGIEIDDNIVIEDSLEYHDIELPGFNDGLDYIFKKNSLIKQSELNRELNDLSASYEFTQLFPKLNAFGNWQVQAQENDDRSFAEWRYKNSVSVGLSLSIPIFSGFANYSRIDQAELEVKKSDEMLKEAKKQIRNQYESVYTEINKLKEQIEAYDVAVKQSELGYEIASKRYNTGLGTQIEVTNSLVDLSNSKIQYMRAVSDYFVKHAELEKLLGKSAN